MRAISLSLNFTLTGLVQLALMLALGGAGLWALQELSLRTAALKTAIAATRA